MYLHIGKENVIKSKDIIGIFNIDYIGNTKEYRRLYSDLEENNNIINVVETKSKTFILTENKKNCKGYLTNMSVNTITKRLI